MAANISHLRVMGKNPALTDDAVLRWLPKQQLCIDPTQYTQLSGENGLRINISPGSFINLEGKIVTGKITLELVELTSKAAMVLAARPSTCRDGVFESAGMFGLEAKSGASDLNLVKPIQVEWPINSLSTRSSSLQIVTLSAASTRSFTAQADLDWCPILAKARPALKLQGRLWMKLSIDHLGWYSVQQPLAKEGLKSMLSVRYPDQDFEHKQAFLIFRNHQAVVKLFPYENKFCAFNIPRRAAASVVMLAYKNGHYYLGHTSFDGHSSNILALNLEEVEASLVPQLVYAFVNVG